MAAERWTADQLAETSNFQAWLNELKENKKDVEMCDPAGPVGSPFSSPNPEGAEDEPMAISVWAPGEIYTVIPGRLSFTSHESDEFTLQEIRNNPSLFFCSTDLQERYFPLCADFGPVNLGIVTQFCDYLHQRMTDMRLASRHIVYYFAAGPDVVSNATFLLSAYLMLEHGYTPEQAVEPFSRISQIPIVPFRDATYHKSTFNITVLDCLHGMKKAVDLGWFSLDEFDLDEYFELDDPRNGDMHRIGPKFIAFRGPDDKEPDPEDGLHHPKHFVQKFRALGVSTVVRLNEQTTYHREHFEAAGYRHVDLFYQDCTTPSDEIMLNFFGVCDTSPGVVAVHCLAGLGRTGTLIGVWMMKNYGFTAREAIAWLRIVRPGSVIGPQQYYLAWTEQRLAAGYFPTTESLHSRRSGDVCAGTAQSHELAAQVSQGLWRRR